MRCPYSRPRGSAAASFRLSRATSAPARRADKTSILSTASPRPGEPIVCTADLRDKPTVQGQLDGYRTVFQHLLRIEKFDGGVRWVFPNRPGLAALLRNLAEKEHAACQVAVAAFRGLTVVSDRDDHASDVASNEQLSTLADTDGDGAMRPLWVDIARIGGLEE